MNCVDCSNLCLVNGDMLPERERAKLKRKRSDAFIWLTCSRDLTRFEHTKRQIFSQVLRERRCRDFALFTAPSAVRPAWHRAAIVTSLFVVAGLVTATIFTVLL